MMATALPVSTVSFQLLSADSTPSVTNSTANAPVPQVLEETTAYYQSVVLLQMEMIDQCGMATIVSVKMDGQVSIAMSARKMLLATP